MGFVGSQGTQFVLLALVQMGCAFGQMTIRAQYSYRDREMPKLVTSVHVVSMPWDRNASVAVDRKNLSWAIITTGQSPTGQLPTEALFKNVYLIVSIKPEVIRITVYNRQMSQQLVPNITIFASASWPATMTGSGIETNCRHSSIAFPQAVNVSPISCW